MKDPLFAHSLCINLDARVDRWQAVCKEFVRAGVPVFRLSAVTAAEIEDSVVENWKGPARIRHTPEQIKAQMGCHRSHRNAIAMAKEEGWPQVAVFEDDIRFSHQFHHWWHHYRAEIEPTGIWMLGHDPQLPRKPFRQYWKRCDLVYGTFAYIMFSDTYEAVLQGWQDETRPHDIVWNQQPMFISWPKLVRHLAGWSDIGKYEWKKEI